MLAPLLATFLATAASQDVFLARNPPGMKFLESKSDMVQRFMQEESSAQEKWTVDMWGTEEKNSFLHEKGFEVFTTVYTSPPMKLKTGGSFFSFPINTAVPWPKGDYTIMKTNFKIVNSEGKSDVPLSEVYLHHWLIGAPDGAVAILNPCEGSLFYGAGAEMRGTTYAPPEGYGVKRIGASGECAANFHLIRTEDLKTSWSGLNDPKGNPGAAAKTCSECGWAPGRASTCPQFLDGTYFCCFTNSRCPVNNPEDHSVKTIHLQYQVQWTRDMTTLKHITQGYTDIRNAHTISEWNVAPNAKPYDLFPLPFGRIPALPGSGNMSCNDTVCTNSNTWTVGERLGKDYHLCPGKMLWSYMHMHTGAISSTMSIDGVPHCQTLPVYGTDPHNTPGNEKGHVVSLKPCVDDTTKGNAVHLKKGQKVEVDAVYDVDPQSKRSDPFPSGKHGGVMALFYYFMDCDPGTTDEEFVCRQNQCVQVPARGEYRGHNSRARCEKECGSNSSAVASGLV